MLIAAASGRALAASARRAGYAPLVVDGFGDQDTLSAAADYMRADFGRPINGDRLIAALQALAGRRACMGVVCGSGFEDRADLLTHIGRHWPLLGNSAETVARAKDPLDFAASCRAADIPHPDTSLVPPSDATGWLAKRIGGAGGWHIRRAGDTPGRDTDIYFQRYVKGEPISALLLCDGCRLLVLGFSAQWTAPAPQYPFRYGGAVGPAPLADSVKAAMTAAMERLNSVIPLVGLNSADFVVDGDKFHLLEVNPRPSATFDLFEPDGISLFALHLDACSGTLPASAPSYRAAMAAAIVYAEQDLMPAPAVKWPDWTADRPVAGSQIKADQPLCSVFARCATARQARRLVEKRRVLAHKLATSGTS